MVALTNSKGVNSMYSWSVVGILISLIGLSLGVVCLVKKIKGGVITCIFYGSSLLFRMLVHYLNRMLNSDLNDFTVTDKLLTINNLSIWFIFLASLAISSIWIIYLNKAYAKEESV